MTEEAIRGVRNALTVLGLALCACRAEESASEKLRSLAQVRGAYNAINVVWDKDHGGWPDVPHGSSFVMVTSFSKEGCPQNRSILTYSLSVNPASPYYADQTRMFSRKQWVNPPFCESDITHAPGLKVTRLGPSGVVPRR